MIAGRYRLGDALGCGGMAEVRDGWDTHLDRPVAVKLLHPVLGSQPEMRTRFRDEARAAASLNHPNIVSVYDSGEHDGVPFIVMERLPGTSLADEIARGPLAQERLRGVLDNVLGALHAAHSARILHRDIKPGNILHAVSGDTVKLADFGIAKALDAGNFTRTGEVLGTMAYLSPERIAGAPASIADDLYAVGVVGFESLAGRPRFSHGNAAALAHAIMTDRPPPVSAVRPDVEPSLAAVVERAMAPVPTERFDAAADMLAALQGRPIAAPAATMVQGAPVRTPTKVMEMPPHLQPVSLAYVPPAPNRASRRTKVLAAAGIGVVAAVAAVAATIIVAASQSPPTPAVSVPEPTTSSPAPAPTPVVSTPPPVIEQAPPVKPKPGNGRGNGNGNGKKDKKDDD
ncbi:serine/threonine-protein kinase [Mycolicibacterium pyrenivorans]|uniref:serine/threonine-protein kinase n=1 Tax=Mycolicibacterium pyrenivorans TaxID=187102 RepID=UPI0021F26C09|nr:serine/threonine-protein kinase [Mycolicibacterium pyrenivorans]MCV7152327.1 serine/threonine protein kinase [Mycolicibacterium pyrenivorans]